MAHTAPPASQHRRLERVFGVVLLLTGVSVAWVAISALGQPHRHQVAAVVTPPAAAGGALGAGATRSAGSASTPELSPAAASTATSGSATPGSSAPGNADPTPTDPATPGTSQPATPGPVGASATPSGSASSMTDEVAPRLPVIVLDNTAQALLAQVLAGRLEQGGWTVAGTSTFEGDILSTAVYYDPDAPGAQASAELLQAQFPGIQRVKPKFDGLPPGPIVVIVTDDYS